MIIAIDYDETYTKDERLWDSFIHMAQSKGHEVICVTMRYPREGDDVEFSIGKYCVIYFTGRKAKEPFLKNMGIFPDIWIDDSPAWIYKDAR